MKLIKLSSAALLAMLAMGTATTVVHAADGGSLTTKGTATFTAKVDPDPVDPIDPDDPDDPTPPTPDPAPTPTPGPLSIDFAPTFDFGSQEISSSTEVYNSKPVSMSDGTTRPNYVQVTDSRGTLGGWNLSVKQEAQFSNGSTGLGSSLTGAAITMSNGHINSNSEAPADKFEAKTTLVPGTASATILGASKGAGAGTSQIVYGSTADGTKENSVSLTLPGKTIKLATTYTTDLTWTLSDTPA